MMRFAPDGKRLVCIYGLQLYIVDLVTGATTLLPTPEDGGIYPDWSPDGTTIVYAASGIRLLDLATGESHLIPADPSQVGSIGYGGDYPLWSPDGSQIALIQHLTTESRIAIFRPDGTGYRVLAATGNGMVSYDILHWYSRPARGLDGVAFRQLTGPGVGVFYVNRDGTGLRRFEYRFNSHQAFSPDGEWVVRTGIDPVDSVSVLFVERVDDVTGATRRQLTYWKPPTAPLAAPRFSLSSFLSPSAPHIARSESSSRTHLLEPHLDGQRIGTRLVLMAGRS
jgi:WD40 repeat protein